MIELYCPELLVFEVLNALWKAVKRELTTLRDVKHCCEAFIKLSPRTVGFNSKDHEKVFEISVESGLTFYDVSYMVTALNTRSMLITSDRNLYGVANRYVETLYLKDY